MTTVLPPAGRVRVTNPNAVVLQDLTNEKVQDQIRERVRNDVEKSYRRRTRAAARDRSSD